MEQQEKKKTENYGRRRQSKSTLSFPIDLTSEILLRLPDKSVAKFRCVSKLWSSITTDPYFINLFEARSPRTSLLICIKKDENMFVSSIPQHTRISNRSYSSSQTIDRYHMKFTNYSYFPPTESVHGLICFQESGKPMVWNPSKRQFLTLPRPKKSGPNYITMFLGYDPVEGKHKVVCITYYKDCDVCRVLTLGSAQESWRTVRTNYKHRSYMHTYGRCIKGVIYYLAYSSHTFDLVLMSFDVKSEKFDMRVLPYDIRYDTLINYGGRLACVDRNNGRRLWILEEAKKDKWSSQDFLPPFGHRDPSLNTDFRLTGFTHAGEFIYVPSRFHKSFYILFFDPVRNINRRLEFKRIAEDGSWLDNGVGNDMYELYAFPNHIENQMSL